MHHSEVFNKYYNLLQQSTNGTVSYKCKNHALSVRKGDNNDELRITWASTQSIFLPQKNEDKQKINLISMIFSKEKGFTKIWISYNANTELKQKLLACRGEEKKISKLIYFDEKNISSDMKHTLLKEFKIEKMEQKAMEVFAELFQCDDFCLFSTHQKNCLFSGFMRETTKKGSSELNEDVKSIINKFTFHQ